SGSVSTTGGRKEGGGRIGGPSYDTPLRVVIAFKSLLGLTIVLLGRVPEFEVEHVYLRYMLASFDGTERGYRRKWTW
nr:hypothetical protein [Tanacetum cinerariifolium]